MIRMEPELPGRAVRVIGALTGDAVQILRQAVDGGATVLDLSEVSQVDNAAVQVLAELSRERCALVSCPPLARDVARLRASQPEVFDRSHEAWMR